MGIIPSMKDAERDSAVTDNDVPGILIFPEQSQLNLHQTGSESRIGGLSF